MPSPELIAAFDAANERRTAAVDDFVPLLVEMALASIAEVLPDAKHHRSLLTTTPDELHGLAAPRDEQGR